MFCFMMNTVVPVLNILNTVVDYECHWDQVRYNVIIIFDRD